MYNAYDMLYPLLLINFALDGAAITQGVNNYSLGAAAKLPLSLGRRTEYGASFSVRIKHMLGETQFVE